jgi:hypothetical protein
MSKKALFAAVFCAAAVGGPVAAFAGEVKGPPGTPNSTNTTGAPEHANSVCAFNGLNDLNPEQGQTTSIVQTPGNQAEFPGQAGHGTCAGGTNLDNPPDHP